ncbi:MAG TPA: radical SAM protein [Myxococcota bacterium]|nr:radical SAM protein [Myxococcota bacterium]HQK50186.1 radical SAM protein [Myxococcota bacterium]
MGFEILSAVARRRGHEVRLAFSPAAFGDRNYLDTDLLGNRTSRVGFLGALAAWQPDVVLFSPTAPSCRWALSTARKVRETLGPTPMILFGGPHASAVPRTMLSEPSVDAGCVGEGELAFEELLIALADGRPTRLVPGFWTRGPNGEPLPGAPARAVGNLDDLPFPDKGLYEDAIDLSLNYGVMAGRGCPMHCAFCFNSFWHDLTTSPSRRLRMRSPGHVLKELRLAKQRYAPKWVEFFDDVFLTNRRWMLEFLPQYRNEIGIPFSCQTVPTRVDDQMARSLRNAGCEMVILGVQSLDTQSLRRMDRGWQHQERIAASAWALKSAGIRVRMDQILAIPEEPLETLDEAIRYFARIGPERIATFWFRYLPGTKMLLDAVQEGRVSEEEAECIARGEVTSYYTPELVEGAGIEGAMLQDYLYYETILKSLPLLGDRLRRILPRGAFRRLPVPVARAIPFLMDVGCSALRGSLDWKIYGRIYGRTMLQALLPRKDYLTVPGPLFGEDANAPAPSQTVNGSGGPDRIGTSAEL